MTSYYHATFIGDNAADNFMPSHNYMIEVRQHWFGKLTVRPVHGYAFKPVETMQRTYRDLKSFLNEWHIVALSEPFDT